VGAKSESLGFAFYSSYFVPSQIPLPENMPDRKNAAKPADKQQV
jgi:hypothetical protein